MGARGAPAVVVVGACGGLSAAFSSAQPAQKVTIVEGKIVKTDKDHIILRDHNNKDVTVVAAAITVAVKKPFVLELSDLPPLTPGQVVMWKGKIQRHPLFKEAVQLKLDGLPASVALATPIAPIAANASEWQLTLKVDEKAAPMAPLCFVRGRTARW